MAPEKTVPELTREFFRYYPDYAFCRALAVNIQNGITTYRNALEVLAVKARAAEQNREEIGQKLNNRSVLVEGERVRIKDLSLRQIMDQPAEVLEEIAEFYFKHPYAHSRTPRSRLVPRLLRTVFLSVLVGHAKRRGLDLDYDAYFEMLRLL